MPVALDPTSFLHFVEQRIERGKGELQGAARALADLASDFEALEGCSASNDKMASSLLPRTIFELMRLVIAAPPVCNVGIRCSKYKIPIFKGNITKGQWALRAALPR